MSTSILEAIAIRLNLSATNINLGPRAARILREHQRQADANRHNPARVAIIIERCLADLAGRSSNESDDPTRRPNLFF